MDKPVPLSRNGGSGTERNATMLKNHVDLFADCSIAFLEMLLGNVDEKCYVEGEIIVEEEEHHESLIVLLDGAADVIVKERRLGRISSGAVLGQATLQHFSKQLLTLRARAPCRVLHVPASVVQKLLLDSEFSAERGTFVGKLEERGQAAERLRKVPSFSELPLACAQAAVLEADYVELKPGNSWTPSEASRCKGQGFIVITDGHGCLQLEGFTAAKLTPGDIVSECILRHHHGAVVAADSHGNCSFYRLSLHDLLAAVLHFPEAEEWFNEFREHQNAKLQELKMGLSTTRHRIAARAINPRDQDIQSWVAQRQAAKTKARGKKNSKKQGQIVKPVGGVSLPFINRTYGLEDDRVAYRVAVCSRA